jgi:HK97 family phage portal protein
MDLIRGIMQATATIADLRNETLWDGVGDSGRRSAAGVSVSPEGALSIHTYYAAIRAISEDIGKCPLITYRDGAQGRERVRQENIYRLLHDEPNPEMTAMSWRETGTSHMLGWGNHYAEIERSVDGEIVAFWPIHASRVRPTRDDKTGRLFYRVWTPPSGSGPARWVDVPGSRMFHPHGLGPDGTVGYSIAKLAAESLGVSLAAQEYGARFFANGAMFQGVIKYSKAGDLKDEAYRRLRESFMERLHGANHERVWMPPILEDGMDWQQVSVAPEDTQFIELQKFQRSVIASWFRIAPHKIGDMEAATFSNIEHQAKEYVTDTLTPHAVRWESELRRRVFADSGFYAEHLFDSLLRGDSQARGEFYTKLFTVGAMSQNDIRRAENDNVIENGDVYYTPVNVMSEAERQSRMDKQGAPEQAKQVKQPLGGTPEQSDRTAVVTYALYRELKADARTLSRIASGADHAQAVSKIESHFERREGLVREAILDAIMTATPAIDEGRALACAGNHAARYVEGRMGSLVGKEPNEVAEVVSIWSDRQFAEREADALVSSLNGEWK